MKILTKTVKAYKFAELSDDAKEKAVSRFVDINVDYEWWDSVYEDAKNIGLELNGFDIDQGNYCHGKFIDDAVSVAKKIKAGHGKKCETYKTAMDYLKSIKGRKEHDGQDDEFLKSLLENYRIMLSKEWDYLTSEKAIIETIEANDYDFTEDGTFPAI